MKWLLMFFVVIVFSFGCDNHKPQAGQIYLFAPELEWEVAPIRVKIISVRNGKIDYNILGGRTYYGLDWEIFKGLACAYCEPI